MNRIKAIVKIAWIEALESIISIKGLAVFLMMLFFVNLELEPVATQAMIYKCKVGWAILPYLHTKVIYTLIFAFSVLYYYSEVPFLSDYSNYQLLRVGRKQWVAIKFMRIFFGAFLLMLMEAFVSILVIFPNVDFSNRWGAFWNTFSLEQGIDLSFPRNIVILYTPVTATLRVFLVGCFIIFLMGMLEFTITLFLDNKYAVIICGLLACGPVLAANSEYANIYYISPVAWIGIVEHSLAYHYTGPRMPYMCVVLLFIIVVLSVITKQRVKSMNL